MDISSAQSLYSTPNLVPANFVPVKEVKAVKGINGKNENYIDDKDKNAQNNKNPQQNIQDSVQLSDESKQLVKELKQRDSEVRRHEQSHVAAGGGNVKGGIQYKYTQGPDNKQYATGGHVSIDTSPVSGDPDATIAKAKQVRKAALAPGNPSTQDRNVASQATAMEAEAKIEKQSQDLEENQSPNKIAQDNQKGQANLAGQSKDKVQDNDLEGYNEQATQASNLGANYNHANVINNSEKTQNLDTKNANVEQAGLSTAQSTEHLRQAERVQAVEAEVLRDNSINFRQQRQANAYEQVSSSNFGKKASTLPFSINSTDFQSNSINQNQTDRAINAYASQRDRFTNKGYLAPMGTGIAMVV